MCIDNLIHVYVDFNPILSTNSPDDAIALLIAMYTIFELTFDKKSRTIRFIYSVLHGDKRYLSNSLRFLIKEKNIDIQYEQHKISSTSFNSACNSSIIPIVEFQTQTQSKIQMNSSQDSLRGDPPPSGIVFRYSWIDLPEIFMQYECCVNSISCKFLAHKVFALKSY